MPHAVIEYSAHLEETFDINLLMEAVHKALLHSGEFGEKDIKVRLYPCHHSLVGGKPAGFVHCLVYLLSGRSGETKKSIASSILAAMRNEGVKATSISVDMRDLDRDIYAKHVS